MTSHQTDEQKEQQSQMDQASKELLERANKPQPPFTIAKNTLVKIATACQERSFADEVELLQELGGDSYLEKGLCTNFKTGIKGDTTDIERRTFAFQNNEKPEVAMKGFIELLLQALDDLTLKILMVAAILSIAIEVGTAPADKRSTAWIEGLAIIVAVVVCSTVTATNDYQKERQFQKLNNVADERKVVTVFRDGVNSTIHNSKVLVGDLVILQEGMEIPADGYVIQAAELTTDESAMTGETDPVKKDTLANCLVKMNEIVSEGGRNSSGRHEVPSAIIMSGTRILNGEGKMIITVVGDSSCVGKISALLRQSDPDETPLQSKLTLIAEDIGKLGLYSAIFILVVMLIRFTVERIYENKFEGKHVNEMLQFFILAVTVVVVAIPEGLPLSVTLSLAFSVKKMLNDNNLVRKLQACETMGGANTICSDKTGTLTKNVMTLTTWWNKDYQPIDYEKKTLVLDVYMPSGFQEYFIHACALNSSAQLRPDEKGSKTEVAILQALEKFGHNYEEVRAKFPDDKCIKIPFSSKRKRMSCIVTLANGRKRIYVKGASEMVLRTCNKFHNKKDGTIVTLDDNLRKEVNENIKRMADNALRTICLAYRDLSGNEDVTTKDGLGVFTIEQSELTLMGVFGIADVVRPEVPVAVAQCKRAGIKVRMVTGDNLDTARAIAIQCGIIDKDDKDALAIEGPDFIARTGGVVCRKCQIFDCDCPRDKETARKEGRPVRVDTIKNGEVFDSLYKNLCVMARSRPEDKYALVTGLIERDNVVAVTGDGTNDAPALKKADVGFAMGIAGTEVARQAADIILLDDNFKSIVAAVMWGRNIYDSIKKFLQFQLTVNIVAVFITLIGAAIIKQEVVTPIQLLWVNLIMDTFASLALATEPPTEELLLREPHNRFEYIVSRKMVKHILGQAILQIILLLIFVFGGEYIIPEEKDHNFTGIIASSFVSRWAKTNNMTLTDSTFILSESDWVSKSDSDLVNKYWPEYLYDESLPIPDFTNETQVAQFFWKVRYNDFAMTTVRAGREKSYSGLTEEYDLIYTMFTWPSRHFTFIFNLFVMMQVFNFMNARKINDEFNIFEGISRNGLFLIIVSIILGAQLVIVTFGSVAFHCYKHYGLSVIQWLVVVGFSAIGNFWSIILKTLPEKTLIRFNMGWDEMAVKQKDEDESEEEEQDKSKLPKKDEAKQSQNDALSNLPSKKNKLEPLPKIGNNKPTNPNNESDRIEQKGAQD